jgi:hypothetical protein
MIWKPRTVVDRIAGDLTGEMEMGWLERTPQKLAHIACWYRQLVQHRGYLLFVSKSGWAVLMDPDYQYLQGSGSRLVQIKGIEQAKTFIDALLEAQNLLADK